MAKENVTLLSHQEIQEQLYRILCSFDDYCRKHEIRYYLCAGTLLGAVRHQGFIPWDDDIDVIVPRPDYMKLIECTKKEPIAEHLDFICFENGKFDVPHGKVIDERIAVEEEVITMDNFLWIDVFPVDGLPADHETAVNMMNKGHELKYKNALTVAPIGSGRTLTKAVVKIPVLTVMHLVRLIKGKRYFTQQIQDMCNQYDYDQAEMVGILAGDGVKSMHVRAKMENSSTAKFNDRDFPIPGDWDEYMKALYGNYMQLPPENKRVDHKMKVWFVK